MSFFGLTLLGSGSAFERVAVKPLDLHKTPDARFEEAFRKYEGICAKQVAHSLSGDSKHEGVMLRSAIIETIKEAVDGRELSQSEISAVMTYFDTDSCALITIDEFMRDVHTMKERTMKPTKAGQYTSNSKFREDRHRHRRADQDPQHYFMQPLTNNQEIGWHARSAEPPNNAIGKKYFPLRSTEITECEGRGVNDYYGV